MVPEFAVADLPSEGFQPWFLNLWWKICLYKNCNVGSWVYGGRFAFGRTATLVPVFAVEHVPSENSNVSCWVCGGRSAFGRTESFVPEFALEHLPSKDLQRWFLSLRGRSAFGRFAILVPGLTVEDLPSEKLQPWFLSLRRHISLRKNCIVGSWICGRRPAFGRFATFVPVFLRWKICIRKIWTLVPKFAVEYLIS